MNNINNLDQIRGKLAAFLDIPEGKNKVNALYEITDLLIKKLDEAETETLIFKAGQLDTQQKTALDAHLYISNNILSYLEKNTAAEAQQKKGQLSYRIIALKNRMELKGDKITDREKTALLQKLTTLARDFKGKTFAITEANKSLTDAEIGMLEQTIESYPEFARLILDPQNNKLQEEFFRFTILSHQSADVFVQYPATQSHLKKSNLVQRLAAYGSDMLQVTRKIKDDGQEKKKVTLRVKIDKENVKKINILNKHKKIKFSKEIDNRLTQVVNDYSKSLVSLQKSFTALEEINLTINLRAAFVNYKKDNAKLTNQQKGFFEYESNIIKDIAKNHPHFVESLLDSKNIKMRDEFFNFLIHKDTVEYMFDAFEQKTNTDNNDFNVVKEGIVIDNATRYDGIKFDNNNWYEDLPVLKILNADEVQTRYNMDNVPDVNVPLVISRSSSESGKLDVAGTHAFMEIAVPTQVIGLNGEVTTQFRIYSFGKFPKQFDNGSWNLLKPFGVGRYAWSLTRFLGDTREGFISHHDQNSDAVETKRRVYSVTKEVTDAQLAVLMNLIKEDIQRGINGDLIFSFQSENCAHWVQHTLDRWYSELKIGEAPQFFDHSLLKTELFTGSLGVIKGKWIKSISWTLYKVYKYYILPIIFKLGSLFLSPERGIYVMVNGEKVWKSVTYSEFWNGKRKNTYKQFHIYHPAKIIMHANKHYNLRNKQPIT